MIAQSTLIVSYYQKNNTAASIVTLKADTPCDIAQHTFTTDAKWQNLNAILTDVATVGATHIRIFSNEPFDLNFLPEIPPNVDRYYWPERGGKGKYVFGRWGGNADYWQVLTRLNEYRTYKIQQVTDNQIPGTVKLWQELNQ